jgi:predicted membrane channel-forming protein YqfA (hemolysin III family)
MQKERKMVRKAIGIILMIAAGVLAIMLLTYGGPIMPHILGPITLAIAGVLFLAIRKKADHPAK